ncbi:MAG: beta-lactamase family protein [Verrucomicrobia bacterium]|jgi:serine beta-lactamase-like protein LACTB, mitochondrial|nr:beta-lactamase family protein [Verrucomicrobiota bacterium]
MTAAVAIDGAVVWTGAVGWADLNARTPASRDTVMRIGSTSKAVTATALARLVDSSEMSLDAPLSDYHDHWPNTAWNELTPRQLASHTAGLPGYENNGDRMGQMITLCGCRHYTSVVESLAIFDGSDLIYEPGTDFAYSSFDVNLLGAAISFSQEQPFLDVLARLVFDPLELVATGSESDGKVRSDLAQFYQQDRDRVRTWKPFDLSQRLPGGGLVSTSADLVRIGCSWLDPEFISIETRQAMWTPQVLKNGDVNEQNYAIGWRYYPDAKWPGDDSRALPFAHHGGTTKGAMSWLVVYPDYQCSIAININTRTENYSDFNSVEGRIAGLFLARLDQLREE